LKICLVCSPGGHLDQMKQIEEAFKDYEYFYVTFKSETTKDLNNTYLIEQEISKITAKNKRVKYIYEAFNILKNEKPDIIVTTGGGEIAIPFAFVGKILGAKIILIESLTRISKKSAAGKIIYPFSDIVLVQWKSLLQEYGSKGKYWGKVI